MQRPRLHLICNAHLDPVWQWRWEEGCAAALATFRTAAEILRERPGLVFNHNEAILYRWVERYDPPLFEEIRALVREGRWAIAGGWDLQPDVNLPGLESLVRHILDGRRWFRDRFGVEPRVAWNFDSFGHPAGLPQVLRRTGYRLYIHMRPQPHELALPSDLYRWRGSDGSEVLAYRIAVGLYHTERDNLDARLREGTELALRLRRDVPVFWGLGDHGGGPTREDLDRIESFRAQEGRVDVVHSSAELLLDALEEAGRTAPLVEGDLQRCFAGCYTSLSRLKRRARENLGLVVGTEALCAAAWWARGVGYPSAELLDAWRDHLFDDFHDILPGTATASAEGDALDLYGRSSETARRARLGAVVALAGGSPWRVPIPVTVAHTVPSVARAPVEVECMLDERPRLEGEWHLELFDRSGARVPCQEEQPESLLPFNGWRRKVSFLAELPGVGTRLFRLEAVPGKAPPEPASDPGGPRVDPATGLVGSLDGGGGRECLAGPLLAPGVVRDEADSWGSEVSSWRDDVGRFALASGPREIERGPVRVVVESVLTSGQSRVVAHTVAWTGWPVVDIRLRIHWNEERHRLVLSVPTTFASPRLLVEVPGGAIERPADGTEHVHGRWLLLHGEIAGRPAAIGIANAGQHGLSLAGGELRLSVLRSAAHCHEKGFALGDRRAWRFMDQGVHDVRLFAIAGDPEAVRTMLPGLADLLERPPFAVAHLPAGARTGVSAPPPVDGGRVADGGAAEVVALRPTTVRLVALKRSEDREALVVRLHEAAGRAIEAELRLAGLAGPVRLAFRPFELKTVRVERDGVAREVDPIGEE